MKKKKLLSCMFFISCFWLHFSNAAIGSRTLINDLVLQTDGKMVAVGKTVVNDQEKFLTVRYQSNGTLDTTFGTAGIADTLIGLSCSASCTALQSDGKIIVAGTSDGMFALARYTSAGALDTAFGTSGITTTAIGDLAQISSMGLQTDGSIVVSGLTILTGKAQIALARYTSSGVLDATFGTNGIVTTAIGARAQANALAIQTDGKIVVGGTGFVSGEICALVCYTSAGSLDATFGSNGIVTTSIGGYFDQINTLVLQSDGKIIAAGTARMNPASGTKYQFALMRYTSSGVLDTTFGAAGIVTTAIGTTAQIYDVALQSNGKIVVGGSSESKFALARYSTSGELDTTFDTDGVVTTRIGVRCQINAVAVDTNSKIIVAGFSDNDFALERYNTNGSIDTTLGTEGIIAEPGGLDVLAGAVTFLWDEKSTGTNGGAFQSGEWRTRALNKISGNRGKVSLSNNQFILQSGVYEIYAQAPANKVQIHQARLYNVTDAKAEKYGSSAYSNSGVNGILTSSEIRHVLFLSKAKTFEIQHQSSVTRNNDGFGIASGFNENAEVYTHVQIIHH